MLLFAEMHERNDFALVPRPPGALERAKPGARRIVSDMVSDTLALAKKEHSGQPITPRTRQLRIIMVDDVLREHLKILMEAFLPEPSVLAYYWPQDGLDEVKRQHPDLFTMNWVNGQGGPEMLQGLVAMKVRCPIFVISSYSDFIEEKSLLAPYLKQGLNISLLGIPFNALKLNALLNKHLGAIDISPSQQHLQQQGLKETIATNPEILQVDNAPCLLSLYPELLKKLPNAPGVVGAYSAARALALLENDAFRLVITPLHMFKMDGLELLSIVRRKYPKLRTMLFTPDSCPEVRNRAYALGVDLCLNEPRTEEEVTVLFHHLESVLKG